MCRHTRSAASPCPAATISSPSPPTVPASHRASRCPRAPLVEVMCTDAQGLVDGARRAGLDALTQLTAPPRLALAFGGVDRVPLLGGAGTAQNAALREGLGRRAARRLPRLRAVRAPHRPGRLPPDLDLGAGAVTAPDAAQLLEAAQRRTRNCASASPTPSATRRRRCCARPGSRRSSPCSGSTPISMPSSSTPPSSSESCSAPTSRSSRSAPTTPFPSPATTECGRATSRMRRSAAVAGGAEGTTCPSSS